MVMQPTHSTIRFCAELDGDGSLLLPREASAAFPSGGRAMVEGTLDGFPFRAPFEGGRLVVSAALQHAAGTNPGDTATIEITRIDEEPEVRVPSDFQEALERAGKARALFEQVTANARREWVRWIASAKQEKTREKRIEVGIDKLSKGMRRPCCFPGLNFGTKGVVEPEETWAPLPAAREGGRP
jgi:Bacteriocin-protection, YdeI or OmpD-Associated/Domain of unknown function (DUF1905)